MSLHIRYVYEYECVYIVLVFIQLQLQHFNLIYTHFRKKLNSKSIIIKKKY